MKHFSTPRLAIVLWFLNYSIFSLVNYMGVGGHEIMLFVVVATACMAAELVALGFIEDLD